MRRRGVELACSHPYREAARLLSAEFGVPVDHRALWRWVQADGDRALRARAEAVNALFRDGEAPSHPDRPVPDALTVAVDATGIRCVDGTTMSAKLAVAFTSSKPIGHNGKRRLVDRHIYADLTESDPFGMALAEQHGPGDLVSPVADRPLPVRPVAPCRQTGSPGSRGSEKTG